MPPTWGAPEPAASRPRPRPPRPTRRGRATARSAVAVAAARAAESDPTRPQGAPAACRRRPCLFQRQDERDETRSEEHTSELQSRPHLVCRLLLEKKKK